MKRLLIAILIFAFFGAAAFADFSASGQVRTNFGMNIFTGEVINAPLWMFDVQNTGTWFQLSYNGDGTGAWARLRATPRWEDSFAGEAWVQLGRVEMRAGRNELRFSRFSGLGVFGEDNRVWGAGASTNRPFIQWAVGITKGAELYFGLQEAGAHGRAPIAKTPGVFLGYDHTVDGIVRLGVAFAGQYVSRNETWPDNDTTLPFMISLFTELLMLDPISIGINTAFFRAPVNSSMFAVVGNPVVREETFWIGQHNKDRVLETMIDARIPFTDNVGLNVTGAFLANFAGNEAGSGGGGRAFMAGAALHLNPRGAFMIIPGVRYTHILA